MSFVKKVFLVILLTSVVYISCSSSKVTNKNVKEDNSVMHGMIYDFNSQPLSDVEIYVNNVFIVSSDVQGRFLLAFKDSGEYSITLKKNGFEVLSDTFIYNPLNILYFRIANAEQLLKRAEYALENHSYDKALNFVDRALVLENYRNDILYLKCIVCHKLQKTEEAKKILEDLKNNNCQSFYLEKLESKILQE